MAGWPGRTPDAQHARSGLGRVVQRSPPGRTPLASTLVQSAHLLACTWALCAPQSFVHTQASWELEILRWLAEEEPKLSEVA